MSRGVLFGPLAFYLLAAGPRLWAQAATAAPPVAVSTPAPIIATVPPGEFLVLELQDELNTRSTRKGDRVKFVTLEEVLLGGSVVIPKGSTVHGTVKQVKRPGLLHGKANLVLDFNEVVLPDGTSLALAANLSRAGWWKTGNKIEPAIKGEDTKVRDLYIIGQNAAAGALIGAGSTRGRLKDVGRGAARGAAIGAAVGILSILFERGPDLDLPPGMMFEVQLTQPLNIPATALATSQLAANPPPPSLPAPLSAPPPLAVPPTTAPTEANPSHAAPTAQPAESTPPAPQPAALEAEIPKPAPPGDIAVATSTTPLPPARPSPPAETPVVRSEPEGYTLKVNVNLVTVEATVRDQRGGLVNNLAREDFRLFEDGVPQEVSHFSRDELPLAVALVVDRSGSIEPVLTELHQAALDTLSMLKPEDQVALFAFEQSPERLEDLTTDRQRIADRIRYISAGGGTNLTDALFEAALYLGRAARTRRHAIILVSDNQGTVRGYSGQSQVIRLALETESVIYSVKIGDTASFGLLNLALATPGTGSVRKMAEQTGGEVIDVRGVMSLTRAMGAIITRLKQRYTLGFSSTNQQQDGSFRRIDVRLAERLTTPDTRYTIYSRRGYYAPRARATARPVSP